MTTDIIENIVLNPGTGGAPVAAEAVPDGVATTTIDATSDGTVLPQGSINVISTSGFTTRGIVLVQTSNGLQAVSYTGTTATTLTGCTGGTGTMATGGMVRSAAYSEVVKLIFGKDATNDGFVAKTNPLPVTLYDANGYPIVARELRRIRRFAEDVQAADLVEDGRVRVILGTGQKQSASSIPVVVASDQSPINIGIPGQVSVGNSTDTPLVVNQKFTGTYEDVSAYDRISIVISGTVVGGGFAELGFLTLTWSTDGFDNYTETFTTGINPSVSPNTTLPYFIQRPVRAKYFKLSFTNSSGAPADHATLNIQTIYSKSAPDIRTDWRGRVIVGGAAKTMHMPKAACYSSDPTDNYTTNLKMVGGIITGYCTAVVAAAKAANTVLMCMSGGDSTRNYYITRISLQYAVVTAFAAAAVPSTLVLQSYVKQAGVNDFTGGTLRTARTKFDPSVAGTLFSSRDNNAALTDPGVTFSTVASAVLAPCFTVSGSEKSWTFEFDGTLNEPLQLNGLGGGYCLRTGTNAFAATGTWMYSYTIEWFEITAPDNTQYAPP